MVAGANVIAGPVDGTHMEPRRDGAWMEVLSHTRFIHRYIFHGDRWYYRGCVGRDAATEKPGDTPLDWQDIDS